MRLKFLIHILLIVFFSLNLYSANKIDLPCDTVSRHSYRSLPVIGEINGSNIELIIEFNAMDIDIPYVLGGEDYAFDDDTVGISYDMSDLKNSKLYVRSNNINPNKDTLFFIQVRALLSERIEYPLKMTSLKINGNGDTSAELKDGCLYLSKDEQIIKEENTIDIGLFYPNPTSYEAILEFTINKDTEDFEIRFFNGIGTQVCSIPDDYNSDEIKIFNLSGQEFLINPNEKNILVKGRYKLRLLPYFPKWSQGTYFVVFKANGKTHKANFIIQN